MSWTLTVITPLDPNVQFATTAKSQVIYREVCGALKAKCKSPNSIHKHCKWYYGLDKLHICFRDVEERKTTESIYKLLSGNVQVLKVEIKREKKS